MQENGGGTVTRWVVVDRMEIWPRPVRGVPRLGPPTLHTSYWQGHKPGKQLIFIGRVWGCLADAETFPSKRAALGAFRRSNGPLASRQSIEQVEVQP